MAWWMKPNLLGVEKLVGKHCRKQAAVSSASACPADSGSATSSLEDSSHVRLASLVVSDPNIALLTLAYTSHTW